MSAWCPRSTCLWWSLNHFCWFVCFVSNLIDSVWNKFIHFPRFDFKEFSGIFCLLMFTSIVVSRLFRLSKLSKRPWSINNNKRTAPTKILFTWRAWKNNEHLFIIQQKFSMNAYQSTQKTQTLNNLRGGTWSLDTAQTQDPSE